MNIQKADYLIPSENNQEYEKVHFTTDADQVEETSNRKFLNSSEKDFLSEKEKILLQDMIVNNFNSSDINKVASAKTVKELYDLSGGVKIVISKTQPSPEQGKTILWIEDSEV